MAEPLATSGMTIAFVILRSASASVAFQFLGQLVRRTKTTVIVTPLIYLQGVAADYPLYYNIVGSAMMVSFVVLSYS